MSNEHLKAMLVTQLLYASLAAAYYGWGRAFIWAAIPSGPSGRPMPRTFSLWAGWAVTLFVFQCIHFFFPITAVTVIPVLLFGMGITVFATSRWLGINHGKHLTRGRALAFTATTLSVLLLSTWVSLRSILPDESYDVGLYHLSTVRWINSFPVVLGLGNLHGRLAFNQSFFTYVAALNLYPMFCHGLSVANSFLFLIMFLTLLEIALPVIGNISLIIQLHPFSWFQALLCLPVISYWALNFLGLPFSGPSGPDLASSVLQLIVFVMFVGTFQDFVRDRSVPNVNATVIALLAATCATIKLSNLAFCGVIMVLIIVGLLNDRNKRLSEFFRVLISPFLVLSIMFVRGVLLSGAPFYPSVLGYVHTEWSVPVDKVIDERNWIYSWARQPYKSWEGVLGNWNWLRPWFENVMEDTTNVVYPLVVFSGLLATIFLLSLLSIRRSENGHLVYCLVLSPLLAGLVFWFFTAPSLRFAFGLIMLAPISSCLVILAYAKDRLKPRTYAVTLCCLFLLCNLNLVCWAYCHRCSVKHVSSEAWQPVRSVPVVAKVTKSGLWVYTPVSGDQCWDAPLPCTPVFNENLRLIDSADMSAGFTVLPFDDGSKNAEEGTSPGKGPAGSP